MKSQFSFSDGKLVRWSIVSCALAVACLGFVSNEEKNWIKKEKEKGDSDVVVGANYGVASVFKLV